MALSRPNFLYGDSSDYDGGYTPPVEPGYDPENTLYVRSGASGSEDGSDWTNAFTALPASLQRGYTYYVADGAYSGYTFDDAESGSAVITIKKATVADHGTETGWLSAYGDGQAIFENSLTFTTDHWVFDGQTRNAVDWFDTTAYGFVVDGGSGGYNHSIINGGSTNDVTIRYTYGYHDGVHTGADVTANRDHGIYSVSGLTSFTFEYGMIQNTSWKAGVLVNSTSGPVVIRYCAWENIYRKELISARGSDNVTFAFNKVRNVAGTGAIVADDSDNWDIYGNWFWSPDSSYDFTDVILGTWTGDHPDRNETLNNWKIYNNTFYQMRGSTQIQIQNGTGNEARNNLFIGFSSSINGAITVSDNLQNQSTAVVNGADSGDFTLAGATIDGYELSSPYDVDMTGTVRGADGTIDCGAFEYAE